MGIRRDNILYNPPPPEQASSGQRLSAEKVNAIIRAFGTHSIGIGEDPVSRGGLTYNGPLGYRQFFELSTITTNTFRIQSNDAKTNAFRFANVKYTIGDGTGMTWNANDYWQSGTISGTNYVYLKWDRAGSTVVIEMDTSDPDGDDDEDYRTLWKVEWDGTNSRIDASGIIDYRLGWYSIPAMV